MKQYDFDRFQAHPIVETDILRTRDESLFRCILEDYETQVVRYLIDYKENVKVVSKLLGAYIKTLAKIHAFERKSGWILISFRDSKGKLRQNCSYLKRLSKYL